MKSLQYGAIALVVLAISLFTASNFIGSYELKETDISLFKAEHQSALKEVLSPMFSKEYGSAFAIVSEYNTLFNTYNNQLKGASEWDKVIWDDYRFTLAKSTYRGSTKSQSTLWFLLTFGLASLGGIAYASVVYRKGDEAKKGPFQKSSHSRGWLGIVLGSYFIGFYIILYFFPYLIVPATNIVDFIPKGFGLGTAGQWTLYGVLYTVAVVVMGVRMLLKYRNNAYQKRRTWSVIFFQTAFAFLLPNILMAMQLPYVELHKAWPLDYEFFVNYTIDGKLNAGAIGTSIFVWGLLFSFIAVPLMTYFFGKRWYCSWVCGCGGLAETLGDPFRQLSDKSTRAWKIERIVIHSVLILAIVTTTIFIIFYFLEKNRSGFMGMEFQAWESKFYSFKKFYGFYIGALFSGVVGTGFYPLMGNRVWCRFGCPLAAYMGLIQRFKSRFRITTNGGQCISCGNCSTYCEMGIDVRAYAQKGQNVVRASCVGCGICASVCPRGVLKLENNTTERIKVDEAAVN